MMKLSRSAAISILLMAGNSHAQEPAAPVPVPRDHVDTTVVGDSTVDSNSAQPGPASITTSRHFSVGAPELVNATSSLHLSVAQKTRMHELIENADAGAADLIKRENTVKEMLAATTSEDPLYAKLKLEQASADSRWNANRNGLRQSVVDLLTPGQRLKFEKAMSTPSG